MLQKLLLIRTSLQIIVLRCTELLQGCKRIHPVVSTQLDGTRWMHPLCPRAISAITRQPQQIQLMIASDIEEELDWSEKRTFNVIGTKPLNHWNTDDWNCCVVDRCLISANSLACACNIWKMSLLIVNPSNHMGLRYKENWRNLGEIVTNFAQHSLGLGKVRNNGWEFFDRRLNTGSHQVS